MIVYGNVRGGAGTAGTRLTYNGSNWLPATANTSGTPGIALSGWSEGQIIQIVTPSQKSIDNKELLASDFGAKGDATVLNAGGSVTGTPDEVAIQRMLDFNVLGASMPSAFNGLKAKLDATGYVFQNQTVNPVTGYRLRCPVQMNDFSFGNGNITTVFEGEAGAQSGLVSADYLGPAVIPGNAGIAGGNHPESVLDPSGSGEWLMAVGPLITTITIAAGSNNVPLPVATINVNSTSGMPPAGKFAVIIAGQNPAIVHYTGISGNSFTGCTGGTGTLLTGQAVTPPIRPLWNLGDSPTLNSLIGVSSFTWEYFVNPGNLRAWITAQGGTMDASAFGCEGHLGDSGAPVASHQSMLERYLNLGASNYLEFRLTTTAAQYIVNSSTSVDHLPPDNTLTHVAIQYNNATQTLDIFIGGAQPDTSMHLTGLSGSLNQQRYEMITVASGQNTQWPLQPGLAGITIPPVMLGRMRLSTIARYTSGPFTPPTPSQVTCDGNTRWFQDFDPNTIKTFPSGYQSPSIPTRPGLRGGYTIAQSGNNRIGTFSGAVGFPCWMYTRAIGTQYGSNARVRSMLFSGWGEGIHTFASLNGEFGEDCQFTALENPIILDMFSYGSGIGSGANFQACGASTDNGMAAEVYFANGSQASYIKERYLSNGSGCQAAVVAVSGDLKVHGGVPNTYKQAPFIFVGNIADVDVVASPIDDNSHYSLGTVIWAPNVGSGAKLKYSTGLVGLDRTTAPVIVVGAYDTRVEFDASVLGVSPCPLVSFQGRAAAALGNPVVPVIVHGPQKNISAYIDPANPGPVQVKPFIDAAPLVVTPTANAGLVLGTSGYTSFPGTTAPALHDSFYPQYTINTGAWTGAQSVTWVASPRAKYRVHNASTQTANLTRVGSGTHIACTAGQTLDIWDNGTDLVNL